MSSSTVILKNIAAIFSSTAVSRVAKFLFIVQSAVFLGPALFGDFSMVATITAFFVILANMGISKFMIRELSRDPAHSASYLSHAILINAVLGFSLWAAALAWQGDAADNNITLLFILTVGMAGILDCVIDCFAALFASRQEMGRHSFNNALINTLIFGSAALLMQTHGSITLFACAFLCSSLLRLLLAARLSYRHYEKPSLRGLSLTQSRFLMRAGLPFAMSQIFVFIYYFIDILMVEHYWGSAAVGQYNAAFRIIEIFLSLASIITAALFPAVSALHAQDREKMTRTVRRAIELVVAFFLPACLVIAWHADFIVTLLYGESFLPAIRPLAILMIGVAVIFPSTLMGSSLRSMRWEKKTMIVGGGAALLNTLLNLAFVPEYGIIGASWTTLTTECFILVCYFLLLWKAMGRCPLRPGLLILLALNAGVVAGLAALDGWNIWLATSLIAMVYTGLLFAARILTRSEIMALIRRQPVV